MIVSRQDPTACPKCGSTALQQDPDVLDTWFSSGLWPFSTLGWPEETPDYRYFYPTSVLETGYDILFFWVTRMIMDGLEFTGQAPFHTVYLHGLIRDEHSKKMSKSYGNVIDPLLVMDEMGTDALRFTLLVGSSPGNDISLSLKKVEANRNFANKLWNVARFVINALGNGGRSVQAEPSGQPVGQLWTLADSWIWARLQSLVRDVERLFGGYQYGEAGRMIYDFLWSDFADWYVEVAKLQLEENGERADVTRATLVRVLDQVLRLLHPFTPFVTEELWGHLKAAAGERYAPQGGWEAALIVARWPEPRPLEGWEEGKQADFALVQELVRAIRNLRSEKNVKAGRRIPAVFAAGSQAAMLEQQAAILAALAQLDPGALVIANTLPERPDGHVALVVGPVEIYLPLAGMVDVQDEHQWLEKELAEVEAQIQRLAALLDGPFAQKAPAAVVQKEQEKLSGYRETAEKLRGQLS